VSRVTRSIGVGLALLVAACCPKPTGSPAGPADTPLTPPTAQEDAAVAPTTDSTEMTAGPPLSPSGPLLTWLAGHGGADRKLLRLPVVITFSNPGRFAIGTAFVGTAAGDPPADAILLKLDGTGLSVGLVEQVRNRCADNSQMTCVLWLDGLWGPRIDAPFGGGPGGPGPGGPGGPGPGAAEPGRHPFAVVAVGEVVDPATAITAFVEK